MSAPVLLLSRKDVAGLVEPADYLVAVEAGFRASKEGRAHAPAPMHILAKNGAFHAKGASFDAGRPYVALKLNGNFPQNPQLYGLPTIQGAILLCDAVRGSLLAIIDSIEITLRRTAAASALAARYLSRADSAVLCIVGCGDQGRAQTDAMLHARSFHKVLCFDSNRQRSIAFAREMTQRPGIEFRAVSTLGECTRVSDVIVTCTTAETPILTREHVEPGSFIAAVGADSPHKNEIAPDLMAVSKIVVDVLDQCIEMGDLHHALSAGAVAVENVYADLGDLVTGARPGRTSTEEIFIFDSTGTALQDAASASLVYERAMKMNVGMSFMLDS